MFGEKKETKNLPAKVEKGGTMQTIDDVIGQIAEYPEEQLAEINPFRLKLGIGGQQVIMLDDMPMKEINGILLKFHSENVLWQKNEEDKDIMECMSRDAITPDPLPNKRAETCLKCPHNQRNTPRDVRCKNNKVLYIFAPEQTPFPIVMRVSPTGIPNFKKFMTTCTMKNVHYNRLAIKIATEEAKSVENLPYTKPTFTIIDELGEEHYEQIKLYISKILPQFVGRNQPDTSFNTDEMEQ